MSIDITPREGDSLLSCPHTDDVPEGEITHWYRLDEAIDVELENGVDVEIDSAWVELCGACRDRQRSGESVLGLVSELGELAEDVMGIDPNLT